MPFAWDTQSTQEYARRAVLLAAYPLVELHLPISRPNAAFFQALAWGKVEITTWTHKINGLTESDFILAAKIDQLYKSKS